MNAFLIASLTLPLLAAGADIRPERGAATEGAAIAVYGDAASTATPPPGWNFQWNARGNLGQSAGYESLSYEAGARAYGVKDASGALRTDAPCHTISRGIGYLDISTMRDSAGVARCYVASYKLNVDPAGDVWINHGNLRTPFDEGTDLQVHVNDQPKAHALIKNERRFAEVFQFNLGHLKKGDVINLALGPVAGARKGGGRLFYVIEDCPAGVTPAKPAHILSPVPHASTPQFGADGRIGAAYAEKHQAQCAAVAASRPELIFIGDSITARWPREMLEGRFSKQRPVNLGIGGDWIQNVLWRVQNGALEKAAPKVIVLLIGINNLTAGFTPDEVTQDVATLLETLQHKTPASRILLLGILPRGPSVHDEPNGRIRQTNALLATLADQNRVFYLDVGESLVERDGTILLEVMPDRLHVAGPGYTRWMQAMGPVLEDLLAFRP
jgi:lysophospholipase L1-like esterase